MPGSCGSCALGETLRSNVVESLDDRPPEHARHPARLGRAALDRFDAPIAPRRIVVPSVSDDDVFGYAIEQPLESSGTLFCGMVTMTSCTSRTASSTATARAPVSWASDASDAGPREFATRTWSPSSVSSRASVPPMWPAPMIPILMRLLLGVVRLMHRPKRAGWRRARP